MDPRFDRDDLIELVEGWHKECGQRVQRRRGIFNLHRRELADLCSTTEASIIRVEAGEQNPRDELRLVIATVLRCEVADLWPYPSFDRINNLALDAA